MFNTALVLEQLRCSGLMGAVKLMQGTTTRVPYGSIMKRVKMVGSAALQRKKASAVFCEKVMQVLGKTDIYALGKSKPFQGEAARSFMTSRR